MLKMIIPLAAAIVALTGSSFRATSCAESDATFDTGHAASVNLQAALADKDGLGGKVDTLLAAGRAREAFELLERYLTGAWSPWKRCTLKHGMLQATAKETAWSLEFFDASVQTTLDGEFLPGAVQGEEEFTKQRDGTEQRKFHTVAERETKVWTTQVRQGDPAYVTSNYSWSASGFLWSRSGRGTDHILPVAGAGGIRFTAVFSYYTSDHGDVPVVQRDAVREWKGRVEALAKKVRAKTREK